MGAEKRMQHLGKYKEHLRTRVAVSWEIGGEDSCQYQDQEANGPK